MRTSVPSHVEIPHNIVNVSKRMYEVNVNGFIARFELPLP